MSVEMALKWIFKIPIKSLDGKGVDRNAENPSKTSLLPMLNQGG